MSTLTTASNTELQQKIIGKKFTAALRQAVVLANYATDGKAMSNTGNEYHWLRPTNITPSATPLVESDKTDGQLSSFSFAEVSGLIQDYGKWLPISTLALETMAPGAFDQISNEFAFYGSRSIDLILYNAGVTTSNYFKSRDAAINTGTLTASETLIAQDLTVLAGHFHTVGVPTFPDGRWIAALHPNQITHLQGQPTTVSGLPTWSTLNQHVAGPAGQGKVQTGDAGELYGFRIKSSPVVAKIEVDTGVSGYQGLAFGQDGLGRAGFDSMNPTVMINRPDGGSTDNPLRREATVGVMFRMAAGMLDANRVVRVLSAV